MDTLKNEMLIILNRLNEIFDSNNCKHLQLLLYLTYLNDYKDEAINQMIETLILKTKKIEDKEPKQCNNVVPKDIAHPYFLDNNLNNLFISYKLQDFLNI